MTPELRAWIVECVRVGYTDSQIRNALHGHAVPEQELAEAISAAIAEVHQLPPGPTAPPVAARAAEQPRSYAMSSLTPLVSFLESSAGAGRPFRDVASACLRAGWTPAQLSAAVDQTAAQVRYRCQAAGVTEAHARAAAVAYGRQPLTREGMQVILDAARRVGIPFEQALRYSRGEDDGANSLTARQRELEAAVASPTADGLSRPFSAEEMRRALQIQQRARDKGENMSWAEALEQVIGQRVVEPTITKPENAQANWRPSEGSWMGFPSSPPPHGAGSR
jgi:hypothetical protein